MRAPRSVSISAGVKNKGVAMDNSTREVAARASTALILGRVLRPVGSASSRHQRLAFSSAMTSGACSSRRMETICSMANKASQKGNTHIYIHRQRHMHTKTLCCPVFPAPWAMGNGGYGEVLYYVQRGFLWVQCETPEIRFLKCSIKWDVLTFWFSPVFASLLHSFYSLENTTLSLAYFYSRSLPARRYAPQ